MQWNPNRYLDLVAELQPQVVTLPDRVGDFEETAHLIRDFAVATRRAGLDHPLEQCQHMVVVQQHPEASLFEWARAYASFDIGFCDWIAFPRILGDRRIELIAGLQRLGLWQENIKHHAFGMNAGSLDELPKLNTLGIYSCDSSAPVWRGLNGYYIRGDWPDIPFDPHHKHEWGTTGLDATQLMQTQQLADRNLAEVLSACQQKWEMPSPIKAARI